MSNKVRVITLSHQTRYQEDTDLDGPPTESYVVRDPVAVRELNRLQGELRTLREQSRVPTEQFAEEVGPSPVRHEQHSEPAVARKPKKQRQSKFTVAKLCNWFGDDVQRKLSRGDIAVLVLITACLVHNYDAYQAADATPKPAITQSADPKQPAPPQGQ